MLLKIQRGQPLDLLGWHKYGELGQELAAFGCGRRPVRYAGQVMLFEKIGMPPHTLKNQAVAVYFVNEQPIRFDVAVSTALPLTDKLVVAMDGGQRRSGEQAPGNEFEFFRIFSTAQTPFYILFKLTRIDGNKHASESQPVKQVGGVLAHHQVAPVIRFPEGAMRRCAGNDDVERQEQGGLFSRKGAKAQRR